MVKDSYYYYLVNVGTMNLFAHDFGQTFYDSIVKRFWLAEFWKGIIT